MKINKEITIKKRHYGKYTGEHSGYLLTWEMNGSRCSAEIASWTRGTINGFVIIDEDGIRFEK